MNRKKPTNKDYGRRHYVSDDDYQIAMRRVPDKAVYNENIVKQSEFKKPYRKDSDTYEEMEYHYPDFNFPDLDWPQPNADVEGEIPGLVDYGLVHCFGDFCYCKGQTKCFPISCTYPLIKAWFSDARMGGTATQNEICIYAPTDIVGSQTLWYDLQILQEGKTVGVAHLYKEVPECDASKCCSCSGISIGYTTQQMAVNEVQTLTVVGAVEGCTYDWAITSGGGSLSAATGTSVDYTAPAANAECADNPTITLSVGITQCDSLYISVNAEGITVAGYHASLDITTVNNTIQCCTRVSGTCYYRVRAVNFNCNNTYGTTNRICSPEYSIECDVAQYYAWCSDECAIARASCDLGECSDGCAAGLHDTRTAAQKTAGCCPLELM